MRLVVLGADDWHVWRALRLEALTLAASAFGSRLDEWQAAPEARWRARLDGPRQRDVIVRLDDGPVGMVTGWLLEDGTSAVLTSLYVAPAARGAGVGTRLIEDIAAWARSEGRHHLQLDVRRANPAVALYRRLGFVVEASAPAAEAEAGAEAEQRMVRTL